MNIRTIHLIHSDVYPEIVRLLWTVIWVVVLLSNWLFVVCIWVTLNFLTLPVCLFIQFFGIQYSTHFGCCTCVRPPNIKSTPNRIATRETRASWAYFPPAHTFQPIRVVYVMNLHSFGTARVACGDWWVRIVYVYVRLIFNIFRSI